MKRFLGFCLGMAWLASSFVLGLGVGGCGGGDASGDFACFFEKSVTDGCDGFGFGPFEAGCEHFNSDDYVITPEEVCNNITTGGVNCESTCCVDADFQNVHLEEGFCS